MDPGVIDRIRQQTEAAENNGNVGAMRRHFADDIVMMAPNMSAVIGSVNVAQAMQAFFDAFQMSIQYRSDEIVSLGEWAFDRGTYRQTLTPKQGGPPIREAGKYLWLYRWASDGSWKQTRVIWNSNEAS
jgi:ketosteroid isomerase-like protein